ncbi:MAG TPA: phage integrase SAM-like domain-containing protein, partial [Gemmataceae bacterium]|nr:phage integrase SAM-like domain-containing protein [Gemmataceae bacterium]
MASISRDRQGFVTLRFFDPRGRRLTARVGKMSAEGAKTFKNQVEKLINCQAGGYERPLELALWENTLADSVADKLAKVGLVPKRKRRALGDFLDEFLKAKVRSKPNSLKNYRGAVAKLLAHFDRETDLRDITPERARGWAQALADEAYSKKFPDKRYEKATIGRLVKFARQFFNVAMKKKLITENPFSDVKAHAQTNEKRK